MGDTDYSVSRLHSVSTLLKRSCTFSPGKFSGALVLMLLSSLSSGVGILLLVPMLGVVGVDVGTGPGSSGLAETFATAAEWVGLEIDLLSILLLYLLLIVVMASLNAVSAIHLMSLRQSFVVSLRNDLGRKLFYTQWRFLNSQHTADFMRMLSGQVGQVSSSLNLLLTLLNSLILVSVYIALSMLVSVELTLMAIACAIALALLLLPINKKIAVSGRTGLRASTGIHRLLFENLGALKIIKSYAAEEQFLRKTEDINTLLESQSVRMTKYNALTRWVNLVGAAIIFAVLFYSSIKWLNLPVSNLLVLLFIFSRLMPQVSSIQSTVQNLIHLAPVYQDLLARASELEVWSEARTGQTPPKLGSAFELNDISYRYPGLQGSVLTDLSARIERNQTVAIVGPSGVGKSTLADIVAGLTFPSSGEVLVDGLPLTPEQHIAWRQSVAYVTQDVLLFHDSIRNNLTWVMANGVDAEPTGSDDEIWKALELVAADKFVRALPDGLETEIGDRGVKLSGGERQRLALARALLSQPDMLILDEATSALDRDNEIKIRDALLNLHGKLTIVIIAHNETTIEHVSQRIVLSRPAR